MNDTTTRQKSRLKKTMAAVAALEGQDSHSYEEDRTSLVLLWSSSISFSCFCVSPSIFFPLSLFLFSISSHICVRFFALSSILVISDSAVSALSPIHIYNARSFVSAWGFLLPCYTIPNTPFQLSPRNNTQSNQFRIQYENAKSIQIVVMLRKVLLVLITVFGTSSISMQSLFALLLISIGTSWFLSVSTTLHHVSLLSKTAAFVQIALKPFTLPEINRLELLSLLASCVTFWAGLMLFVAAPEGARVFASFFIFAVNLLFLLYALFLFIRSLRLNWPSIVAKFSFLPCVHVEPQQQQPVEQQRPTVIGGAGMLFLFCVLVCCVPCVLS